MAKPPATPPSSDVDGVDRDRTVDDIQESGRSDPGSQLERQNEQAKAKPKGTDHREGESE